ncbi:MAG: bifunctional transaldolase/phosoglucose isomerase [Chloroflexota bacterium]
MAKTTLQQLADYGQSPWLDNIRRGLISSGGLQELIDKGIVGVTANPTIFEKAISSSNDYDSAIEELVKAGKTSDEIYKILIVEDISAAADVFRQVYDRTNGLDGFISIEVAPGLAHDTQGTIKEAVEFHDLIKRPNVFIKVPATAEGIPAIEELLYRGINVNITLIFSVDVYRDVMKAYLSAVERRVNEGKPVDKLASVASFFVSRVDTKADKALNDLLQKEQDPERKALIKGLLGTTAINNSKIAYEEFLKVFGADRFTRLKEKGARVQRPLWASTSTKNPEYNDVMYVEDLIGPDTVNTMPDQTIIAFLDHGKVARTIDANMDKAKQQLAQLEKLGISLKQITEELTVEGVESFTKSFDTLAERISEKRDTLLSAAPERQSASLGGLEPQVQAGLRQVDEEKIVSRIWSHDGTVWKKDPAVQNEITSWLGWLDVVSTLQAHASEVKAFAQEVKDAGFKSVVLLGMGGSSLAPEVIHRVLGAAEGYPRFYMLDSTDPGTVEAIDRRIDPTSTLFIVSSKSGGTTEVMSFYHHYRALVDAEKREKAGENFVAITDPGTSLEKLATDNGFRHTFLNMPDIGGRYSALSYFGIVPAALMGVDIDRLLASAQSMVDACKPGGSAEENPGAWLGTIMGKAFQAGRDKVTVFTSPDLDSFGLWAEQLIAESTGKEGKGLVPVAGEPVGRPSAYGRDRLFVYLSVQGATDSGQEHDIEKLEAAGQPVVRLQMADKIDLGAEFFRWEMAVATAGHFIGVNVFDQPNVQESKDNTRRLLGIYEEKGKLPEVEPILQSDGISLYGNQEELSRAGSEGTLGSALNAFFHTAHPGDYVALLAYMPTMGEHEELFQDIRVTLRDTLKVATTFGYGPRFLHSTGQLHKGGPNTGLFIQITCDAPHDLPIPGQKYTFGTLIRAQSMGDIESLQKHGRRAIRLHIRGDHASGVEHIREAIRNAVSNLGV